MTHKVVISGNELKEMVAKRFGVDTNKVTIRWNDEMDDAVRVEVDLGKFYVNKETVVEGE